MTQFRYVSALIALAAFVVTVPAFAKEKLKIEMEEWNISLSKSTLNAGDVLVSVKNKGEDTHEIVFIRLDTDLATGRLPVNDMGGLDEDNMSFGELVDEIEGLDPGSKNSKTMRLKPGRYAVICNVMEEEADGTMEAHYSMGMHVVLNVE